jgi:hypothetical protein
VDILEPSAPLVVGGVIAVFLLFLARELAAGALHAAGRDLWEWFKRTALK